jgi:hypothetical protein
VTIDVDCSRFTYRAGDDAKDVAAIGIEWQAWIKPGFDQSAA